MSFPCKDHGQQVSHQTKRFRSSFIKEALLRIQSDISSDINKIQLSRLQLTKPGLNIPSNCIPIYLYQPVSLYKVVSAKPGKRMAWILRMQNELCVLKQ